MIIYGILGLLLVAGMNAQVYPYIQPVPIQIPVIQFPAGFPGVGVGNTAFSSRFGEGFGDGVSGGVSSYSYNSAGTGPISGTYTTTNQVKKFSL